MGFSAPQTKQAVQTGGMLATEERGLHWGRWDPLPAAEIEHHNMLATKYQAAMAGRTAAVEVGPDITPATSSLHCTLMFLESNGLA
jgi:hypothetical protein